MPSFHIYLIGYLSFDDLADTTISAIKHSTIKHQDHKVGGISDLLYLIKAEFDKQIHRITLLEVQNRNQDEDISLLKIDNSQIHDRIDLKNDEVVH